MPRQAAGRNTALDAVRNWASKLVQGMPSAKAATGDPWRTMPRHPKLCPPRQKAICPANRCLSGWCAASRASFSICFELDNHLAQIIR
jgi:hypothetical protein